MAVSNYIEFEKCIKRVLNEAGYSILPKAALEDGEADIVAQRESKTYYIEVKYSQVTKQAIGRIVELAQSQSGIPVLVTAGIIEEKQRKTYEKVYPQLLLVDISNLLFAVKGAEELKNYLMATLTYSVEGIEPNQGHFPIDILSHSDYTDSLIREMKMCQAGKEKFREYEDLCVAMLRNVFSEDLTLWKKQQSSNKGLYRFDLLCRIKENNKKAFWAILERYFNTKYVVFEFKNHEKEIGQEQIYTTERYLYAKALRSVAVIIAANGFTDNAYWATKGCLRENGKLILLLNTEDLIEMNKLKSEQEDLSEYLLNKLDNLLLDLEK